MDRHPTHDLVPAADLPVSWGRAILPAVVVLFAAGDAHALHDGIDGRSGEYGTFCSSCHSGAAYTTSVFIQNTSGGAPATQVFTGGTLAYRVRVTVNSRRCDGGTNAGNVCTVDGNCPSSFCSPREGGFNASAAGICASGADAGSECSFNSDCINMVCVKGTINDTDAGAHIQAGEITHDSPRAWNTTNNEVVFTFSWTAPGTPGTYRIYAAGNAVNGNNSTSNDDPGLAIPIDVLVCTDTDLDGICDSLDNCPPPTFNPSQADCDSDMIGDACDTDCNAMTCGQVCPGSCGDGHLDLGETCDDGMNNATGEGFCMGDCAKVQTCGDMVIDGAPLGTEECDDADGIDEDDCPGNCMNAACGDGFAHTQEAATEDCDDGGIDTMNCDADCTVPLCGDMYHNMVTEECDDGDANDNDACTTMCMDAVCGDFILYNTEGGMEQCDEGGVQTMTCEADCRIAGCGDGVTNMASGEECDDMGFSMTCDDDCTTAMCGDGKTNPMAMEDCDDIGESLTCDADCTDALCGDMTLNMTAGEICDEGGATVDCDIDCTLPMCGDGTPNAATGEDCDEAGEGPTCDDDCTFVVCGDTNINQTAGEECDDGMETVDCDIDCTAVVCGDGVWNPTAGEGCDTGGESNACNVDCTPASCGDGKVNMTAGEDCDAFMETVVCDANCTAVSCGDGDVNIAAGEGCDEGGETPTCDGDCTMVVCGDFYVNAAAGEVCDDGVSGGGPGCTGCTMVEMGWYCNAPGQPCVTDCGDSIIAGAETCDDSGLDTMTCDGDCTDVMCGDGYVNSMAGEMCDDGNQADGDGCAGNCGAVEMGYECLVDGDPCEAICGDGFTVPGVEDCDDGGPTMACTQLCTVSSCGDGIVNPGANEVCDEGTAMMSGACSACGEVSFGWICTPGQTCVPDCGDGVVVGTEVCDEGGDSPVCDADCTPADCGDGRINPVASEQCDDGNTVAGDGCGVRCRAVEVGFTCATAGMPCVATCGDGRVVAGEQCDEGPDNSDGVPNACRSDCTAPRCGDGVVDSGELCDDGPANDDATAGACRTDCSRASCGDGVMDAGEACDDDNRLNGDGCDARCQLETCGDGTLDRFEQCDNAGLNSDSTADACRTDCQLPGCGDGVTDSSEDCDAGTDNSDNEPNACRSDCRAAYCGDGVIDDGEDCDPRANDVTARFCRNDCTVDPSFGDPERGCAAAGGGWLAVALLGLWALRRRRQRR